MRKATTREELDLSIDENNLLNEWQGQSSTVRDYGEQYADAMQEEDEAKAALAVVAAELDSEIRNNPEDYGLTKTTETVISNTVLLQPEHQVATKKYIEAKHKARVYKAAVESLDQRKWALQGMTDLFLKQWHADPMGKTNEPPTQGSKGRKRQKDE